MNSQYQPCVYCTELVDIYYLEQHKCNEKNNVELRPDRLFQLYCVYLNRYLVIFDKSGVLRNAAQLYNLDALEQAKESLKYFEENWKK